MVASRRWRLIGYTPDRAAQIAFNNPIHRDLAWRRRTLRTRSSGDLLPMRCSLLLSGGVVLSAKRDTIDWTDCGNRSKEMITMNTTWMYCMVQTSCRSNVSLPLSSSNRTQSRGILLRHINARVLRWILRSSIFWLSSGQKGICAYMDNIKLLAYRKNLGVLFKDHYYLSPSNNDFSSY